MPVAAVSRKRVARLLPSAAAQQGRGRFIRWKPFATISSTKRQPLAGAMRWPFWTTVRNPCYLEVRRLYFLIFANLGYLGLACARWSPHGKCCANDTPKAGMIFHFLQTLLAIAAGLRFRLISGLSAVASVVQFFIFPEPGADFRGIFMQKALGQVMAGRVLAALHGAQSKGAR